MCIEREKEMYIELLKKTILFELWQEHEEDLLSEGAINRTIPVDSRKMKRREIWANFAQGRIESMPADPKKKRMGEIWPKFAHSMIGRMRMDNLQMCMETVLKENIEGDFIETGVWRGGACIFMCGFLKVHGIKDRKVWLADSFQGLPPADEVKYPKDKILNWLHTVDYLRVSLEEVKDNFGKYNLLDENVRFLKGWFKDTLPAAPIGKLAILRLDGDLYESTMDSLTSLYDKVSKGGFIIIDDYELETCKPAITDFRREYNITEPLIRIDNYAVYWRKQKS